MHGDEMIKRNPSSIRRHALASGLIIFYMVFGLCPIPAQAKPKDHKKSAAVETRKTAEVKTAPEQNSEQTSQDVKAPVSGEKLPDETDSKSNKDAKDDDPYKFEKPAIEEESYAWVIIKTLIILGIMIGGFYYFFRFVSRKTGMQFSGSELVQVLSLIPLGQNKYLQIVDLAGRVLVLGVTENNINLIMEIKDKDEIDRIRLSRPKPMMKGPEGFQQFLTGQIVKFLNRKKGTGGGVEKFKVSPEETDLDRLEYLAIQKERLKKLNGMNNE